VTVRKRGETAGAAAVLRAGGAVAAGGQVRRSEHSLELTILRQDRLEAFTHVRRSWVVDGQLESDGCCICPAVPSRRRGGAAG
jgi:hypothetical protein